MELALACDIVMAARDVRFGLPEVRRAVLAAEGGLYRSASVLGRKVAMQLALTGEPIAAERAHQLGLVNELTRPRQSARDRRGDRRTDRCQRPGVGPPEQAGHRRVGGPGGGCRLGAHPGGLRRGQGEPRFPGWGLARS
ncbi:enoyl-CoA hydratase-related protein [Amycolatopsis sp. YIM 10]|uniref:enoyl-CoA hydratase-related protein n=1 Tax=Amycolatopsis sp. YIM 10 TaxID=2653857 RepID=UPI0021060CDA|nr:enoyl-CoA hydratase-related protein [Amycolatopsis sp. YIM 10]